MQRIRTATKIHVGVYVQTQDLTREQNKKWFNANVLPLIKEYQDKGDTYASAKKKAIAEYKLFNGKMYTS